MVNSKQKGNAWENTIAKVIRNKFIPADFDAKTAHSLVHRTPMSGGHVEKGDLIIKPPVWKWFPWFFECRNRQSWSWKNVMEKPDDSVIVKWFLEDALDKCHPYDNDATYERYPLLLFTRNQEKVYFCMDLCDVQLFNMDYAEAATFFRPCIQINFIKGRGDLCLLIGSFDTFLGCYEDTPDGITDDINKYLGVTQ